MFRRLALARAFLKDVWLLAKPYWSSDERWAARGLLAALLPFMPGSRDDESRNLAAAALQSEPAQRLGDMIPRLGRYHQFRPRHDGAASVEGSIELPADGIQLVRTIDAGHQEARTGRRDLQLVVLEQRRAEQRRLVGRSRHPLFRQPNRQPGDFRRQDAVEQQASLLKRLRPSRGGSRDGPRHDIGGA
ncbi:hypothetical protein DEW08_22885 (plasmid) [Azospirillum thermophilum]|uniref:Uncharacterized protein n=1 Tax=Azospirillum thermophilum TaxID=2202148 RepID=A0A2S2CWN6_9PROT|nr:hypothetical protein DEW08_22885 [Azospirillum thermophilum]